MKHARDIIDVLDQFCPMHVVLDATGHIIHAGPTLQKLRPDEPLHGQRFLELFELKRPRSITTMEQLVAVEGAKLHLKFRTSPQTGLKGVLVPSSNDGEVIVNLSFGISIVDGVRDYALTNADFAATDLTVEMLYLIEAKSAAMEASRTLNLRLQGAMIAAEEQAFTDTLTGLKNRRAMDHILERLLGAQDTFAMMHIDLDFFKAVNDTLGHAAGDLVLQKVARVMVDETRETDTVARVGGDEFVILFPKLLDRDKLDTMAKRIIQRLEVPIPFEDKECKISASIGTVLSENYDPPASQQLFADADIALYACKHAGRGCHKFYDPKMRDDPTNHEGPKGRDETDAA